MFQWYKALSITERKTLYACFGGWALDALDTQLYSFLIPTLVAAWGISHTQAGILGTSALISSSVGGWVAGILCDRIGRVRVMQLAIFWFVLFTLLSGFTNSYEELLATRILSGLGFGGEWAAGSVLLMGEIIRAEYRGKAVGTIQSAYAIGYAVAALMSSVLFGMFQDGIAWRAMFWIGVSPAIIVFLMLRGVAEPEVFLASKKEKAASGERPISPLAIFHPKILKTTVLTSLLALGVQGGAFAMIIWLPTYLKTIRHISTVDVGYNLFVFTAGSFFGYIVSAYLCDAVGRTPQLPVLRPTLLAGDSVVPLHSQFHRVPVGSRVSFSVRYAGHLQRARALFHRIVPHLQSGHPDKVSPTTSGGHSAPSPDHRRPVERRPASIQGIDRNHVFRQLCLRPPAVALLPETMDAR